MMELSPNECRVLGVLVEKAMTTPEQYPLSLNATTNGSNQKNNRDPVLALSEDEVFDALETLREKSLVLRVDTPGNRVHKYRHGATEALHVRSGELAILAELLMRGPQTVGELRGRASRMAPLDSLEATKGLLDALMTRGEPLVRQIAPTPGSRADRYMQLLCPTLHPLNEAPSAGSVPGESAPTTAGGGASLVQRVIQLEAQVTVLEKALRKLSEKLGESDLLP